MEDALRYYEISQDYHAMVRIHCFCEDFQKAEQICNDTGDKAASYHLARQYDSLGNTKSSIHYFSRAQAYSNAIRLAKVRIGCILKNIEDRFMFMICVVKRTRAENTCIVLSVINPTILCIPAVLYLFD